ncbi:uncharacterized protein JCM15063_001078, partial [Sporobolomyces koalae]|uniref:uncharacterized protein n=1 Tax=Sporobolomyces koalae TaxID=500713 RepID=UPI0031780AFB
MDASQGSQVSLSSPLSSLASSPEPAVERHPSKRPRLSTSPSSAPPLYFAQYRSQPAAQDPQQQPSEDVSTLLDGLDEQVFDLPPSSDPVMRGEDISSETVRDTFRSRINEVGGRLERARRASKEDDSGIGLLPSQEEKDDDDNPREGTVEPPDRTEENIEEDYEGDDMWLGFDDADMGFDEPDTFSSSVSSLKPPRTDVLAQPI